MISLLYKIFAAVDMVSFRIIHFAIGGCDLAHVMRRQYLHYKLPLTLFILLVISAAGIAQSVISPKMPLSTIIKVTLPSDKEEKQHIAIIPYDKEIYELAYRVYLLNANIKGAYAVAAAAEQQTRTPLLQQENNAWRDKLAQTAIWMQNPGIAAAQYLHLVQHAQNSGALQKGLGLSKAMHDDRYLLKFLHSALAHHMYLPNMGIDMVDALLRLGSITEAQHFLQQSTYLFSRANYLLSKIKIYKLITDFENQLAYLKTYDNEYGASPAMALQEALIEVAENQFVAAQHSLAQAKNKALTLSQDLNVYWENYAIISALTGNTSEERAAYAHIIQQGRANERIYSKMIEILGANNPPLTYRYAQKAKQAYPKNVSFAISAFSWALQNSAWRDFPKLDASTPAAVRAMMRYDTAYAELKANYLQLIGRHDAAVNVFVDALQILPTNYYLKSDFLFFLIQTNDLVRLRYSLALWSKTDKLSDVLLGSYAQGYFVLNQPAKTIAALQLFYEQFESRHADPYWLINFKDILDSVYLYEQSWAVTHYAWPKYLALLSQQQAPIDYIQLLDYLKLSIQEAPVDVTRAALMVLQEFVNPDVELLLLTWAFNTQSDALADAIYASYKAQDILPPAWAVLTIALRHEDRYLMRDILTTPNPKTATNPTKVASYRDKVLGAQKIDAPSLAQQYAFEALEQHPQDSDLYDNLFTPAMFKTANKLSTSFELFQYAQVQGPRNITSFSYSHGPGLRITPYNSLWYSNLMDTDEQPINTSVATSSQAITNVPDHDERSGVVFEIPQYRGSLLVDLGYRGDLNDFFTMRARREYQLVHDFNSALNLGYHQPADDSLGMLVGGVKNNILLNGNYVITATDTILSDVSHNFFYTQDGYHVADGVHGALTFEHRFWQTYPDWTAAVYGTAGAYYNKTNVLQGSILSLIPEGVPPTVNFLIPNNFYEYGVTVSFGQTLIENYTRTFRPFASFTLSNNSNVGLGMLYNAGLSGSVLGRDKLLLYYSEGTNQGTGIQIQRLVKASYALYF